MNPYTELASGWRSLRASAGPCPTYSELGSVANVAKPLPDTGVSVSVRMETLITEHDDRLVPVQTVEARLAGAACLPSRNGRKRLAWRRFILALVSHKR